MGFYSNRFIPDSLFPVVSAASIVWINILKNLIICGPLNRISCIIYILFVSGGKGDTWSWTECLGVCRRGQIRGCSDLWSGLRIGVRLIHIVWHKYIVCYSEMFLLYVMYNIIPVTLSDIREMNEPNNGYLNHLIQFLDFQTLFVSVGQRVKKYWMNDVFLLTGT